MVIGCSGGADSVALARLIVHRHRERFATDQSRKSPLVIAHYNHALRGEHSIADEHFVRHLAEELKVSFVLGTAAGVGSSDAEANLREQRYAFFHDVAARSGCRYITLAHTADDQCETILHHLIRGTGAAGMTGMPITRPMGSDFVIRRPLLHARRAAIHHALQEIGQTWREDASNQETRYTRNWIRHDVLPVIRQRFPSADAAILRAAENQSQVGEMLSRLAQQWIEAFAIGLPPWREQAEMSKRARSVELTRPRRSSASGHCTHTELWPHSIELANELPVITTACQLVFDVMGWPRGEMSREHWIRLAAAISTTHCDWERSLESLGKEEPPISLGHWPGGIQAVQSAMRVTLQRGVKAI